MGEREEQSKANAQAFYDMMFNRCKPQKAVSVETPLFVSSVLSIFDLHQIALKNERRFRFRSLG